MPPFGDWLVCGLSTQLQQAAAFDETISPADADFRVSGLKSASLIRLGFLATVPQSELRGRVGSVSGERLQRLLGRLADFLTSRS